MNWLDIVILVMLAIGVFTGLKNGIIKGVLLLAGIIVGVILAGNYYQTLAAGLDFISHPGAQQITAFLIIIGVTIAAASIVAWLLRSVLKAVLLGWVDKLGGAVFGFLMTAIVWGAILATWLQFLPGQAGIVTESAIAAFLLDIFPLTLGLLPEQFDAIKGFFG